MKTLTLYVSEMHCNSCVLLVEETFKNISGIRSVYSDLSKKSVQLTGEFKQGEEKVIKEANKILNPLGYVVTKDKVSVKKELSIVGIIIGLVILVIYWMVQKSDLAQSFNLGNRSWWFPMFIGMIASLSTCMAVVGGLLMSLSASWAKMGHKTVPQVIFLVSRLVGFVILGGILGIVGKGLVLNWQMALGIQIVTGLVMIVLGLNLLGVGPELQFNLFGKLNKDLMNKNETKNWGWVIILGAGTFFLPCGFTQSMQVVALESGSLLGGAMTMGLFVVGTMPVLTLVAFSGKMLGAGKHASMFFAAVGTIIVGLALFNLLGVVKLLWL